MMPSPTLCAKCKGRGWCGLKKCPLMERIKYWKNVSRNFKENFYGPTPPSVFVGRVGYPKVNVGGLATPLEVEHVSLLDAPELWYMKKLGIEDVIKLRSTLVYSRFKQKVYSTSGRFLDRIKEFVTSIKPTYVEVELRKKPKMKMNFSLWSPPVVNPAPLKNITIASNPKVPRVVEKVIDDELKAVEAVSLLYRKGLPVSYIQKVFSLGLLGKETKKKLVPTRWSITAVDDSLGRFLLERIRGLEELNDILFFQNEYLGNKYYVLLFPGSYEYELVEIKYPKSIWNVNGSEPLIFSEYEPFEGKKEYAEETGGAFYAGRLAVLEFLNKIKRQAKVLIVREVTKEYYAPVGIWQMREAVRDSFSKSYEKFESVMAALSSLANKINVPFISVMKKSKLIRNLLYQRSLTSFLKSTSHNS